MSVAVGRRIRPAAFRSTRALLLASAGSLGLAACAHQPVGPLAAAPAPPAPGVTPAAFSLGEHPRPHLAVTELAALRSLPEDAVIARLGKPDFVRRDEPAELWQYRGQACVLDLILYPDGSGLKVAHVTSRDRTALNAPENQCTPFGAEQEASR